MHFSSKIKKYYDGMNVYEHLLEDEKAIHIPFALSFTVTITTINGQLNTFLTDLENKECQEIPDIDFDLMTDIRNIMSSKLKSDMAALDEKTIRDHLEDIFGPHMDKRPSEVHDFIYSQTLQMTEKQEQELRIYIDWGVMRFAPTPSRSKMAKVDYDYHRDLQDCKFEDSEEYRIAYTQMMQFASRHDGMLTIDLRKYGKYIFDYFYQFSESQKVAVFELCVILDLIHEDMMLLKKVPLPEPLDTPEARQLLEKARKAGYLDSQYKSKLSNTKSAILADEIATRLNLRNRWKIFEQFWNRHNMYKANYEGRDQKQSSAFLDEVRKVLN